MPFPNFRADNMSVQPGQCTTLHWDVDDIQAIYFFDGANETGVAGHDSRQVCPTQPTTYRLRIVNRDGGQEYYDLTINTGAPVQINFWADNSVINPGQCTGVHWDVEGVNGVWFNDGSGEVGVGGHEQRTVCPQQSMSFLLRIQHRDGGVETRAVTVNVVMGAGSGTSGSGGNTGIEPHG